MTIDPTRIARAKAMWRYVGEARPPFAAAPGPGQESVWDYPRPPSLAPDSREVRVMAGPLEIARGTRALRLLETASPPTFYLPAGDVHTDHLMPGEGQSHCEWKGAAQYWSIRAHQTDGSASALQNIAWSYPHPMAPYEALAGHFAFYPQQLECFVNGERVRPQPGRFYAGWITNELTGPFKGEAGSGGW